MRSLVEIVCVWMLFTLCGFVTPCHAIDSSRPQMAPLLGGVQTDLSHSPVALILTRKFMCTGVLVGRHEVLTAGHCIAAAAEDYLVIVGSERHTATSVAHNPNFLPNAPTTLGIIKNDLGMILLSDPVTTVTPVPVMSDLPTSEGDLLTVTGRGANELSDDAQPLGEGRTATFSVDDANGSIMISTRLSLNTSTCPGDSGAPVFRTVQGQTYLVGIVSAGTNSANDDGTCIASGRGLSVFVDLQSSSSKDFFAQFDGVTFRSARSLYVNERLQELSRRVKVRSIASQSRSLLKELRKLLVLATPSQRQYINSLIRALARVNSDSSLGSKTKAVHAFRIALESISRS